MQIPLSTGSIRGALPLSIANAGIRAALGKLFTWKAGILVAVVLLSLMFYRPFCKWICPLGAVYALFNKVSLLQMHIDTGKCVSCGKCAGVCKMDVDVVASKSYGMYTLRSMCEGMSGRSNQL